MFSIGAPRKSALQLAESLARRIQAGEFPPDTPLPSCRVLANELHMDKNTVNKAYRILEETGLVSNEAGRGYFVCPTPRASAVSDFVRQGVETAIWQAKAAGMGEDELWKVIGESIWKYYGVTRVEVAIIECNTYEAKHMAGQLEERLRFPVHTLLLQEYLANPVYYTESFDILATTFHHLAAVSQGAGEHREKVIGLHSMPVTEGALQIAKALPGQRIGVVCSTEPSIGTLTGLVRNYNSEIEVLPFLVGRDTSPKEFLAGLDIVVATMSTIELVQRLVPEKPVLSIAFVIDEQSIEYVMRRVMAITRRRLEKIAERESC